MKMVPSYVRFFTLATLLSLAQTPIQAQAPKEQAPWVPLFNGKDLSGWVPVNVSPKTFTARDGMIISTGKPTGVHANRKDVRKLHR